MHARIVRVARSLLATGEGCGGNLPEAAGRPIQTTVTDLCHWPCNPEMMLHFWGAGVILWY